MRLVDNDLMLPGNVVRHVAGHQSVGYGKASTVNAEIGDHAPWTEIETVTSSIRSPTDVARVLDGIDLVVHATGSESAVAAIAAGPMVAGVALVSGALYRGGAVARVQRQGREGDTPIADRRPEDGYLVIPAGEEGDEIAEPAVGCSSPVSNASPSAVLACAALLAHVTVDHLSGAGSYPDYVVDVLRVLPDESPFDALGRVRLLA